MQLNNLIKNNKKVRQFSNVRIITIQNNSLLQLSRALQQFLRSYNAANGTIQDNRGNKKLTGSLFSPLEETRMVIEEVVVLKKYKVDLAPRSKAIRQLQHEIVNHYHLKSKSVGRGLERRVRIYP